MRRPAYGQEWPVGPSAPPGPGETIEYLDHRDGMVDDELLGTDTIALWAMLAPDSVVKANGHSRHTSTEDRLKLAEEE